MADSVAAAGGRRHACACDAQRLSVPLCSAPPPSGPPAAPQVAPHTWKLGKATQELFELLREQEDSAAAGTAAGTVGGTAAGTAATQQPAAASGGPTPMDTDAAGPASGTGVDDGAEGGGAAYQKRSVAVTLQLAVVLEAVEQLPEGGGQVWKLRDTVALFAIDASAKGNAKAEVGLVQVRARRP
jgi:hypothetical protein